MDHRGQALCPHVARQPLQNGNAVVGVERPPLDPETVSAAQKLIEAGLSPARAAKQLAIGRATAYRIAAAARE